MVTTTVTCLITVTVTIRNTVRVSYQVTNVDIRVGVGNRLGLGRGFIDVMKDRMVDEVVLHQLRTEQYEPRKYQHQLQHSAQWRLE